MTTVMGHADSTGFQNDRMQIGGKMLPYSELKNEIAAVRGEGGDQGYIFLGGCNLANRHVAATLAKDFGTSVISADGYVFSKQSKGEITIYANSTADGKGSTSYFRTTSPDGRVSGKIESITMRSDGRITIRGAEAQTGSRVRPVVTIDPEDRR